MKLLRRISFPKAVFAKVLPAMLIATVSACANSKSQSDLAGSRWAAAGNTIRMIVGEMDPTTAGYRIYVYDTRGALSGLSVCTSTRAQCLADRSLLTGFQETRTADGYLAYVSNTALPLAENMQMTIFSRALTGQWSEGTYTIRKDGDGFTAESSQSNSTVPSQPLASQQSTPPEQPSQGSRIELTAVEARMIELTNYYRTSAGLPALQVDPVLMANTRNWAQHVAARRAANAHSNQNVGENAFHTVATADEAVTRWMRSRLHLANIMNPRFRRIGVGVAYDIYNVPYWYQQFYF